MKNITTKNMKTMKKWILCGTRKIRSGGKYLRKWGCAKVQIIAEITYMCPCKCWFCPFRNYSSRETMNIRFFAKAARVFAEFFKGQVLKLIISGGEPSVLPNLRQYVDYAKNLGYYVTIATNVFKPEVLEEAKPHFYQVSIDYWGEKHDKIRGVQGLFSRALKFVEEHENAYIRSTIMNDNIEDIVKLAEWSIKHGKPLFAMPIKGCKIGLELRKLRKNKAILIANHCPAGRKQLVIDPKGNIYPCIFYRKHLGNIRKQPISKIYEKAKTIKPFPCLNQ